jgi:hypothetical protein
MHQQTGAIRLQGLCCLLACGKCCLLQQQLRQVTYGVLVGLPVSHRSN